MPRLDDASQFRAAAALPRAAELPAARAAPSRRPAGAQGSQATAIAPAQLTPEEGEVALMAAPGLTKHVTGVDMPNWSEGGYTYYYAVQSLSHTAAT
ncbi:hypothetical protein ACEZCY_33780 [Streptacidiphilus sp. N1-12]|uniref:Uncharacterized protein n=2 Tax=Streptacidiphilus alkalitolerans TaxID=3342712 RepID=A0ABV6WQE2_9ACTN